MKQRGGTVADYIASQPVAVRPVLQRVRRIIRTTLREAEEKISYGIPSYRLHGRGAVYFAGWKRHWSLYPVTKPVRTALAPQLAAYELSKGTVRFPLADPVPVGLVKRIVRALAKAADDRPGGGRSRLGRRPGPRRRARGRRR